MTKAVTKKTDNSSLQSMLEAATPALQLIAPKYVNLSRLMALALEVYKKPDLATCNPASVVDFCKKCAEWGTDRIGAGGVWAVKYGTSLVPIPDWRMLIQKAKDAGSITHARADVIYSKEVYKCVRGLYPVLEHEQKIADRGDPIAVYCMYILPNGERDFVMMNWEDVMHNKSKSKAQNGPWKTDEVEMAKKTVVKRCMKLFEGDDAILSDMINNENAINGYVDMNDAPAKVPFAMPKINDAKAEPTPEPEPESKEPEVMEVTGVLDEVQSTPTKGKGKRYGLKIGKGWYGTFSKTIGGKAEKLKGKEVVLGYFHDGDHMTIDTLALVTTVQEDSEDGEAAAMVDEITAILEDIGPEKTANIMNAAEIDIDGGEAWEIENLDKLKEILSLAKAGK